MLFIAYRQQESQDKLGLPIDIEQTYTEEFNEKKPMVAVNSRNWRDYNRYKDGIPVPDAFRLPAKLIMVLKGIRRFEPDFFTQTGAEWLVSAPFLTFLKKHRLLEGHYEESELTVVSTTKKPLTNKQYYLLHLFKSDNDLVDFEKTPKITSPVKPFTKHTPPMVYYPDLVFKEGVVVPPLLYLHDRSYWHCFICNEDIKVAMEKEHFLGFTFYTFEEYMQLQIEWEKQSSR